MIIDLRDAIRRLSADRAFAVIAIVTLALGIGANTAIFSLIKSVLLRPLPYSDVDRVVMIWNTREADAMTWLSAQEITSYRNDSTTLERVAAARDLDGNLTGGDQPERVRVAEVTPDLFETLGVRPLMGRTFSTSEGKPGMDRVVVLAHGLWVRRYGATPGIVGQTILMNGNPRTVVGVMAPAFRLPLDYRNNKPTEAFVPLVIDPADLGQWGDRGLTAIALVRRGVAPQTVTNELSVIAGRWVTAGYVADQGDFRFSRSAVPVQEFVTGKVEMPLLILLGTVGFVLLIAVANVANLLLARGDVRGRDIAIRSALGAGRRHLVGQMLTESILLGICGAVLGLALAYLGVRTVEAMQPTTVPRVDDVRIDTGVLVFTGILGVLAGLLFGLVPAVQLSRPDLLGVLHDGGRSGTAGRKRRVLRKGLVVAQMSLSLVLVVGAGLLVRSLIALNRVDIGFDPSNVLTAQLQLPSRDYTQPDGVVGFYRRLEERLEQIPGVRNAGAIRILPLTRIIGDWSITLEGKPYSREENPNGDFQAATPGYFAAMGLKLTRGRFLTNADREDAPMVVVINETMAARYWPGEDALGNRFRMGTADQPWMTIVGIISNVRHNAVVEEPRAEMYLPHSQLPRSIGGATRVMGIAIKTESDALTMIPAVRSAIRELDPNLPISDVQTMDRVVTNALSEQRFITVLLATFASLALALAAIGIYGTISLQVAERAQEIGIRVALGAQRQRILRMILSEAAGLAALGLTIGLGGAVVLSRLLERLLYGVTSLDPLTFAIVPMVLVGVALIASITPALRAAAVDPITTLRR